MFEVLKSRLGVLAGVGIELLQPQVTNFDPIGAHIDPVFHRVDFDQFTLQGHLQQLSLAPQGQLHTGAGFTANQLDRIFGAHTLGVLAVDRDNHIPWLHASAGGG